LDTNNSLIGVNVTGAGSLVLTVQTLMASNCNVVVQAQGTLLDLSFQSLTVANASQAVILGRSGVTRVFGNSLVAPAAVGFVFAALASLGTNQWSSRISRVVAGGIVASSNSTQNSSFLFDSATVTASGLGFPVLAVSFPMVGLSCTIGGYLSTLGRNVVLFESGSIPGRLRVMSSIFVNDPAGNCIQSSTPQTVVMAPSVANTSKGALVTIVPSSSLAVDPAVS
jgi:hypothetical protein